MNNQLTLPIQKDLKYIQLIFIGIWNQFYLKENNDDILCFNVLFVLIFSKYLSFLLLSFHNHIQFDSTGKCGKHFCYLTPYFFISFRTNLKANYTILMLFFAKLKTRAINCQYNELHNRKHCENAKIAFLSNCIHV